MASEYIKYQLKGVKPAEKPPELTRREKIQNWFYYHKWYLLIGAVIIGILLDIGLSALSRRRQAADFEIAYVGSIVLPADTQKALSDCFASLGEDADGNGQVRAALHTYTKAADENASAEAIEAAAAAEVQLIGDMENCDSYFFIVDDPAAFQADYQILADKDGNIPETVSAGSDSASVKYYAVPLGECAAFADAMDASYSEVVSGQTVSGKNSELLGGLYLARRGFPDGRTCANQSSCDTLWERIVG